MSDRSDFRILSLDGGGSKGVYTLGVLKEIEALTKRSLHEEFDLIYGTSTGSIIASLIALEENIEQISETYFKIIPDVMKHKTPRGRSDALARHAKDVFQEKKFDQFKTDIGIIATNFEYEKPIRSCVIFDDQFLNEVKLLCKKLKVKFKLYRIERL